MLEGPTVAWGPAAKATFRREAGEAIEAAWEAMGVYVEIGTDGHIWPEGSILGINPDALEHRFVSRWFPSEPTA